MEVTGLSSVNVKITVSASALVLSYCSDHVYTLVWGITVSRLHQSKTPVGCSGPSIPRSLSPTESFPVLVQRPK